MRARELINTPAGTERAGDECHAPGNWQECSACGYDNPTNYDACTFCGGEL